MFSGTLLKPVDIQPSQHDVLQSNRIKCHTNFFIIKAELDKIFYITKNFSRSSYTICSHTQLPNAMEKFKLKHRSQAPN